LSTPPSSDLDLLTALPDWDAPVPYIRRTHDWYNALGYGNPYRYAHFEQVPFARLSQPLAESRIALLTTAAPYQPDKGPQGAGAPYNAAAKFYKVYSGDTAIDHDLRISHVGIDRANTTDDINTWFPLAALRRARASGRIGSIAPRFFGVPTNRSQRHSLEIDCPEILASCRADGVQAAVLVANCPVCHQTMSLTARYLEAAGIPTVVMGAAKDIVEHCGVPRFLFSDFPLGNAAARPWDEPSQDSTLALALDLLEKAIGPRSTLQNPLRWQGSTAWKQDYLDLGRLSAEEIAARRAANDQIKAVAQGVRDSTLASPSD
jgi:D-proline reductase (dithiol) PrdB